jgi:uncharacterized protein (TIGR00369 family)
MDHPRVTTVVISPSPQMSNFVNKMHGGELLKLLDQVASATSRRYSRLYCVTAKILGVDYVDPIEIGSLVSVRGEIVKVGTTSMTVDIEVTQEDMRTGDINVTNRAKFLMVALDSNGRSTPVPQLENNNE